MSNDSVMGSAAEAAEVEVRPITLASLDEDYQRSIMAEYVKVPAEAFRELITAARNGLRPKLLTVSENSVVDQLATLLQRAVNGPWLDGDLERARALLATINIAPVAGQE